MRDTRGTDVEIIVDGRPMRVTTGITVAAALFNAGETTLRRSVSGEPRAALCGMGICFECRVTVDNRAQQRACLITVTPGMHIRTAASS